VTDDDKTIPDRPATAPRAAFELGSERYKITGSIGRGGMGVVLAASDLQLGREVAVKRLHSQSPGDTEMRRFLHEARIQARLDHPAIVPVYELGHDADGRPYFVMKRVAGTTLAELLKARTAGLQRLLRAFADVCLAIQFAHDHNVIHRDLKPENIVVGEYGEIYVLDWGIAKVAGETDELADLKSFAGGTVAGAILGTPTYMPPEQKRDGSDVDARSDVYALGRVLDAILRTVDDPPPELVALAAEATAEERQHRCASARELEQRVQRYLDGDRDLALRRQLARDQLEQARRAFAVAPSDDERKHAFRAATSAMVLDPTLGEATELVGRLMLEPPREVPREVEAEIAVHDTNIMLAQGRAGLWGAGITVGLIVPLLLALGSKVGAGVFAGVGGLVLFGMWRGLREPASAIPPPPVLALGAAIPIALVAHLFSPLLVAPAIAGLTGVSLAANPFLERRRAVVFLGTALVAAIVLPALAEQLGWLRVTLESVPGGLLMHPALHIPPALLVPVVALFATGMVVSAIALGRYTRTQERTLRRQLHVQAWHLRQLISH